MPQEELDLLQLEVWQARTEFVVVRFLRGHGFRFKTDGLNATDQRSGDVAAVRSELPGIHPESEHGRSGC